MGADGGTIPSRSELTKQKTKPEKADRDQLAHARWFTCAISNLPLRDPIVCDEAGRLYNKTNAIEAIVSKSLPAQLSYLTSLKDLHTVKFQANPKYTAEPNATAFYNDQRRYHCPISLLPVNGFYSFSVQRGCGCVLSDKALREVKTADCVNCGQPRVSVQVPNSQGELMDSYAIQLNPETTVQQGIQRRITEEKAAIAAARKAAKASRKAAKAAKTGLTGAHDKGNQDSGVAVVVADKGDKEDEARSSRKRRLEGTGPRDLSAVKKAASAAELKPKGADDKVWSKLFTSSQKDGGKVKETFLCRSVQHQLYKS